MYPVKVRSFAGEAHGTLHFPFDDLALEGALLRLQNALLRSGGARRRQIKPHEYEVQQFGQQLFDALLTGGVRARYEVALEHVRQQDKGLRIRLNIASPLLNSLPWEFLYDEQRGEYICLCNDTVLVRYLELSQGREPLRVMPPLRILGMIGNVAGLNVERERQRLVQAMQPLETQGLATLQWVQGRTWQDLDEALGDGVWHVLHFVGHGGFSQAQEEGFIELLDDEGAPFPLHATQLGRVVRGNRGLRLVVLNSCEGGMSGPRDIFSSTAATLMRSGLPAVVAMQYEISDRAAIQFSRAFYRALLRGNAVDAALSKARKAISIEIAHSVEWGTPVLFMRATNGMLFEPIVPAPAPAPPLPEPPAPEAPTRSRAAATPTPPSARSFDDMVEALRAAQRHAEWSVVIELGEQLLAGDPAHELVRELTAEGYRERGNALHKQKQYDQAITALNRAIALAPRTAACYDRRAACYERLGDYDRALADSNWALLLEPDNAHLLVSRGQTLRRMQQYARALADYNRAIDIAPTKGDYRWDRAMTLHAMGSYEEALGEYHRAIELAPNRAHYFWRRALTHQALQHNDLALDDLNHAIALSPQTGDYHWERGLLHRAMQRPDATRQDWERAAELGHAKAALALVGL